MRFLFIIIPFIGHAFFYTNPSVAADHEISDSCLRTNQRFISLPSAQQELLLKQFAAATREQAQYFCSVLDKQNSSKKQLNPSCLEIINELKLTLKSPTFDELANEISNFSVPNSSNECKWIENNLSQHYFKKKMVNKRLDDFFGSQSEKFELGACSKLKDWFYQNSLFEKDILRLATGTSFSVDSDDKDNLKRELQCEGILKGLSAQQYKLFAKYLPAKIERDIQSTLHFKEVQCEESDLTCQYETFEQLDKEISEKPAQYKKWINIQMEEPYKMSNFLISEYLSSGNVSHLKLASSIVFSNLNKTTMADLKKSMYLELLSRVYYLSENYSLSIKYLNEAIEIINRNTDMPVFKRVYISLSMGILFNHFYSSNISEFDEAYRQIIAKGNSLKLRFTEWDAVYIARQVLLEQKVNDKTLLDMLLHRELWLKSLKTRPRDFWFFQSAYLVAIPQIILKNNIIDDDISQTQGGMRFLLQKTIEAGQWSINQKISITNQLLLLNILMEKKQNEELAYVYLKQAVITYANLLSSSDGELKSKSKRVHLLGKSIINRILEVKTNDLYDEKRNKVNELSLQAINIIRSLKVNYSLFEQDRRSFELKSQPLKNFANKKNQYDSKLEGVDFVSSELSSIEIQQLVKSSLELKRQGVAAHKYFPTYFKNKFFSINRLNLKNIDKDELRVFYYLFEDKLIIFTVTNKEVKFVIQNVIREEILENVKWVKNLELDNSIESIRLVLGDLYIDLIEPLEGSLHNIKRLVISPDSALINLPFSMLLTPEDKWLIEDFEIIYQPDITQDRRMESKLDYTSFLGIGNPFVKQSEDSGSLLKTRNQYQPLPETEQEILEVAKLFKNKTIVASKNMTKINVVEKLQEEFSIIDFASHAVWEKNAQGFLESGLLLSEGKQPNENKVLTASEIGNLRIKADIIFLSACNTSSGRLPDMEGLTGLASSFFKAGASSVVVTQWDIYSGSAKNLVVDTFRFMKSDETSLSEALRQAQIKMINSPDYYLNHPRSWAAFSIYSN